MLAAQAAQISDPLVAKAPEIVERFLHAGLVVVFDRADLFVIDLRITADDDLDAIFCQLIELAQIELVRYRDDKDAVDAPGDIVFEVIVYILIARADIDKVAFFDGRRLKAHDDLAVKGVGNIIDHQRELHGLVLRHAARDHIRLVIELFDRVQHAFPRLFRDVPRAVEHIRDRSRGNAGKLCDIRSGNFHRISPKISLFE